MRSSHGDRPDAVRPVIGSEVVGVVLHHLAPDGQVASERQLPDGIAQVTIGRDFASPYEPQGAAATE